MTVNHLEEQIEHPDQSLSLWETNFSHAAIHFDRCAFSPAPHFKQLKRSQVSGSDEGKFGDDFFYSTF